MKLVTIVGARPQFIKAAVVSRAIALNNKHVATDTSLIDEVIVHSGQHYDRKMSDIFFEEMGIPQPNYDLDINSLSHGAMTGQMLEKMEEVLIKEKPDVVLVYGDTNTTLAGALAAAKLHVPIVHVEAGLRSFNKSMPEEINRILVDHMSTFLLCPGKTAVKNLKDEGFKDIFNEGEIFTLNYFTERKDVKDINKGYGNSFVMNVGDVMYDVLLYASDIAEKESVILERLQLVSGEYYLLTLHRAESTNNIERLEEIIAFVNDVSVGKDVIFPIHPRTKSIFGNTKIKFAENVKIIDPVDYFDMLQLLKESALVLTDSGGLQKGAYWLKTPCITLRRETEWVETVKSGWNVLYKDYVGPHNPTETHKTFYGDGKAAERIMCLISEW